MNELKLLRQLVEDEQYSTLFELAQSSWDENPMPAILPLLGIACFNLGLRKKANSIYQQALAYTCEFDENAQCDLAALLILMQRIDDAVSILLSVREINENHPRALARLGYCYFVRGRFEEAKRLFKQSLLIAPMQLNVHRHLIAVCFSLNHLEDAQIQFDSAVEILNDLQLDLEQERYYVYWLGLNQVQQQLWVKQEQFSPAELWLADLYELQKTLKHDEQIVVQCVKNYSQILAEHDFHLHADSVLREYLKHYPNNVDLSLMLGELGMLQGHYIQAIELLQTAIKYNETNVNLWVKLSTACLHRYDKKARFAAEKAVALSNTRGDDLSEEVTLRQATAMCALAQVECYEQNFAGSEALFRRILSDLPHFKLALQGLGQQLMQQGRIEEAVTLFEQLKNVDPLKGHLSLINARRFPESDDVLEQLAHAAKKPSLEGSLRSGLLFQLASAWEKKQDYNKAFTFVKLANDASKKFLAYNAQLNRNKCARIRACFNKALFDNRKTSHVDGIVPVFVLGMPRSGTTLVEQILAGHCGIFGAGELSIIPRAIQGINRWERHTGSGRQYPDCIDDLNEYTSEGIAKNILKELHALSSDSKPNAKYIIDKLPHNFENIGLIKFLFPGAKIISVRRDPRDIAISNYFTDYQAKHGGMGFAYDLENIGQQLADHNLLMHHWQQLFPNEILEVNYEDVIDDLEGSARKMLGYIGVAWEAEVLNFNQLARTVKTASVWQVRQPIYKTSKAKWLRYQAHLAPLIKGTNAKIISDPITDLITLPKPGFLTDGVAHYEQGRLDEAELCFKKMLHHNPNHGACNYMLGLVYLSKNHPNDGIAHLEKAVEKCPWQKAWRENLLKAYRQVNAVDKLAVFKNKYMKEHVMEV